MNCPQLYVVNFLVDFRPYTKSRHLLQHRGSFDVGRLIHYLKGKNYKQAELILENVKYFAS